MTTNDVHTDCRSEEGITAGLIDSLISICRVLSKRDLHSFSVQQALADFISDEDVNTVIEKAKEIIE